MIPVTAYPWSFDAHKSRWHMYFVRRSSKTMLSQVSGGDGGPYRYPLGLYPLRSADARQGFYQVHGVWVLNRMST
jgi:hypothetical protein